MDNVFLGEAKVVEMKSIFENLVCFLHLATRRELQKYQVLVMLRGKRLACGRQTRVAAYLRRYSNYKTRYLRFIWLACSAFLSGVIQCLLARNHIYS